MMGKGSAYDCEPLQMRQLEQLLTDAGLDGRNVCIDALRATFEIERAKSLSVAILLHVPDRALLPLRRIIPTLIYRFRRTTSENR